MTDRISYAVDGNVARITLDDGKVNAMSLPFFEALGAALDRAEREKPGAVVITGRAGYFSAGLDLKLMPTLAPDALQRTAQLRLEDDGNGNEQGGQCVANEPCKGGEVQHAG